MGVIEIDPVQLLEDGIRTGIQRRIAAALQSRTAFPARHLQSLALSAGGGGRSGGGGGGGGGAFGSFFTGSSPEVIPSR